MAKLFKAYRLTSLIIDLVKSWTWYLGHMCTLVIRIKNKVMLGEMFIIKFNNINWETRMFMKVNNILIVKIFAVLRRFPVLDKNLKIIELIYTR